LTQPDPRSPWRRRLLVAGLASAFLVLAGAGAAAGYLAWTNKERADDWEARSARLERNVGALNEVVIARTESLNERTEELNALAARVKRAERAIRRSEADVRSLELRQRQLANEKAQVEDARAAIAAERGAIEDVALAYIDCKNGLTELLNHILADDFSMASTIFERVDADCQTAEGELSGYLAAYGD
jgi:septal ring factor EnvC (AmiA/AmiB activator)